MKIERITNTENLKKIETEWNRLLFSSEQNCIFFTHEWFTSWWESFSEDNSLEILLFKDRDGGVFGAAPFMIKNGNVRFICSLEVSDYCDVFSTRGRREEFFKELMSYLEMNYPDLKKIELSNIKASSLTLDLLPRWASCHKFSCSYVEKEVVLVLDLPSSYEEYLTLLSKKNRHELRRKLRRFETLKGTRTVKVTETKELLSSMKTFIALHKQSSPAKERFWNKDGMVDFFHELVRRFSLRKWVELNFLFQEDRILAALLNFSYGNQVSFYNAAFNREFVSFSPGIFLFNHCIKDAISEKKQKVDFLRGREKYKYYFGAKESKIFQLTMTPGVDNR